MIESGIVKKLFSWGSLLVLGPLVLMLLFLMPLEFVVSSWHLIRARDGLTHGKVLASARVSEHGNSRSDIRYGYKVQGRAYESDRVRAGWLSHAGYESGAGELGDALRPGDTIPIYYDAHHPEFALVEYGWPKWSIAFALCVWGLLWRNYARPDPADPQHLSTRSRACQLLGYGVATGATFLGFILFAIRPSTVELQEVPRLMVAWGVISLFATAYGWFRYVRRNAVAPRDTNVVSIGK